MKLGIYGGTFNPPHWGHLTSAHQALTAMELDRVLFIPAATPPHKTLPGGSPTARQRLEMMEIAADSAAVGWGVKGRFGVSDMELLREGKSYTADTLRQLHEEDPNAELWFLMGTDMLMSLQNWYQPEVICSLAHLCAFARADEDSPEALEDQARFLRETFGADVRILPLEKVVELSSTQVREAVAAGAGEGEGCPGRGMIPDPVLGYILRAGLYGTNADLKRLSNEALECCSLSMVQAKRHAHIRGVAETAKDLALRWGEDPELAWKAGILHDCTKYLSLEEHLQICSKYGILLDNMERESAKLLHSKTGAALARHVYGMPDVIYDAIFCHTTGKPDMTLLDKIIYLADYMEPNRDFDGVEELRTLCFEDLDEALLLGLQMSVDDLNRRGLAIHPNTQGALDWALAHRKKGT